jgi:hypothetical protein
MRGREKICEIKKDNLCIRMVSDTIKEFMASWIRSLFGMQITKVSRKMSCERRLMTVYHLKCFFFRWKILDSCYKIIKLWM